MNRRGFLATITFGLATPALKPVPRPPPPPSRVPLVETFVAGFRFHDGPGVEGWLKPGTRFSLVRDPGNAHDPDAIRLLFGPMMVGFVPRDANSAPARLLDHGRRLEAVVTHVDHRAKPWKRVKVRLDLTS